jgi:hypothetical protein
MKTESNTTTMEKAMETAIAHQNEIESTRVGGFGGSDAKMFYKIGLKGLSSLSNSDKVRIRVAKGITPYNPIPQTAAMRKGHDFEDWFADEFKHHTDKMDRERKISARLAVNFDTFAHADFSKKNGKAVIELKCVSDPDRAMENNIEQLQWYHMLGVESVHLVACDSAEESFEDGLRDPIEVWRNEAMIQTMMHGIKLLDDNWLTLDLRVGDEWSDEDLFPAEQREVMEMAQYLREIKSMEAIIEERKAKMCEFMAKNNIKSIQSDIYSITMVPAGTTSRFDKSKLLRDHPEINEADYTTTSERKAYVTVKLK